MRLFQRLPKPDEEPSATPVAAAPPAPDAPSTSALMDDPTTTPAIAPLSPSDASPISSYPTPEPLTTSSVSPYPTLVPSPAFPVPEIQPTATLREIVGAVTQGLAKAASDHDLYVRALASESDLAIPHVVISRATLDLKLGVAGQGNAADCAGETHFLIGADALAHLPAELVSTLSLDLRMERED